MSFGYAALVLGTTPALRLSYGTVWLSFYRVSLQRGSLLEGVTGIVMHDHWKPYYTMEACGMPYAPPITCVNFRP